jgi:hypothetical protein
MHRWQGHVLERFSVRASWIYGNFKPRAGSTQPLSRGTWACQYHVMDCEHFFHFLSDFQEFGYSNSRMKEKALRSTKHSVAAWIILRQRILKSIFTP